MVLGFPMFQILVAKRPSKGTRSASPPLICMGFVFFGGSNARQEGQEGQAQGKT